MIKFWMAGKLSQTAQHVIPKNRTTNSGSDRGLHDMLQVSYNHLACFHALLLGLPLSSSLLLEYSSEYLNEYSSTR